METDRLRRFLFEDAPVRGHWVRLSQSWLEAREHQDLPAPALAVLGESLASVALVSASLKFTGNLTLQLLDSRGAISMLVAQATDRRTLRGVAHVTEDAATRGTSFRGQVSGGRLVVSVEQGEGIGPWQGIRAAGWRFAGGLPRALLRSLGTAAHAGGAGGEQGSGCRPAVAETAGAGRAG